MLGCRDAPLRDLKVASAGAQAPARITQVRTAIDASRRTAVVAAAEGLPARTQIAKAG